MIDVATIRRTAGAMGHEEFKGPEDTCPVCGLNFDDMLKLGRVPRCDAGRWIARAIDPLPQGNPSGRNH